MEKLLVANYKMNGNKNFYQKVTKVINKIKVKDTVVLCPPFVYMPFFKIKNKKVFLGSQDISNVENTKSTGQTSAKMLQEFNCKYSIIGHSERRANGESDWFVADKVHNAHKHNIIPIVCVGEASKNSKLDILVEQVGIALSKAEEKEIIFAYEPIWAIGSGEQPSIEQINTAISLIKNTAKDLGFEIKTLYGGSVNATNYKEIAKSNADGFLMGGVSNKLEEFVKILKGE
ncbi:MAG: triosephosphate isomerase [Clostridia bacterium]|nr:triosephosphate isomerase [Clostridia bacterium]